MSHHHYNGQWHIELTNTVSNSHFTQHCAPALGSGQLLKTLAQMNEVRDTDINQQERHTKLTEYTLIEGSFNKHLKKKKKEAVTFTENALTSPF